MSKTSNTRESLGGVGGGELLCVRCLPKLTIAKIIYKGHSLCMGCAIEVSAANRESGAAYVKNLDKGHDLHLGGGDWDFILDNPGALRKIRTDAGPAAAESVD